MCISCNLSSGLHRLTYIVGEAWCVLTSCKVHGKNCPPDAEQVPVASAAPSLVQGDLHLIGWLAHASILEEEICSALDVVEALQQKAEREGSLPVGEWLRDLRCVIVMAHFCLLHRPNRDSCFFSLFKSWNLANVPFCAWKNGAAKLQSKIVHCQTNWASAGRKQHYFSNLISVVFFNGDFRVVSAGCAWILPLERFMFESCTLRNLPLRGLPWELYLERLLQTV